MAAPVGAGLRRSRGRSGARPGSWSAAAARHEAQPGSRDGPSPGCSLWPGRRGLRAEGPSWGPPTAGESCRARRLVEEVPEESVERRALVDRGDTVTWLPGGTPRCLDLWLAWPEVLQVGERSGPPYGWRLGAGPWRGSGKSGARRPASEKRFWRTHGAELVR
ncbi:hypothetical protein NDU88_002091 [Pleurodeles waltl]|uniref:Uncharacterized protein n=1 Tax=Pleurodeles waltl TaxID=8319 RepID=A0AAV7TJU8_PLEWA|nr:hypothetical protein NDU88_002091 [Pleurodeles waltl]